MAALLPFSFFNCYSFQSKKHMSPNYLIILLPCKSCRPRSSTRTSLSCQSQLLPDDPPPSTSCSPQEEKRQLVEKSDKDIIDQKKEKEKEKEKEKKKKRSLVLHLMCGGEAGNFGRCLKESLRAPRHNKQLQGDWKDLFLMSFSFAVYVYISQKIVCAYCAWMAML